MTSEQLTNHILQLTRLRDRLTDGRGQEDTHGDVKIWYIRTIMSNVIHFMTLELGHITFLEATARERSK